VQLAGLFAGSWRGGATTRAVKPAKGMGRSQFGLFPQLIVVAYATAHGGSVQTIPAATQAIAHLLLLHVK